MVWRILGLLFCLIGMNWRTFGEIEEACPYLCPGECIVVPALWLDVRDSVLGILKMHCIQAECPLTPWCLEVYGSVRSLGERLLDIIPVSERSTLTFLTALGTYVKAEEGKATVCVKGAYEFPIPLADREGHGSVIRLPLISIRGVACTGKCPCTGFHWISPFVQVTSQPTESPRVIKVFVKVTDPNDDVVCVGHDIIGDIGPRLTLAPPEAVWTAFFTTGRCIDSFDIVLPCTADQVVIGAWAKDLKGLMGHDSAVIRARNRPPEVRGKLYG